MEKLEQKIDNLTKVVEAILPHVFVQKEQTTNISPENDDLKSDIIDGKCIFFSFSSKNCLIFSYES